MNLEMQTQSGPAVHPRLGSGDGPAWLRFMLAVGLLLLVAWSIFVYLAQAQRREEPVTQARELATSANQMLVAILTRLMMTGAMEQRAAYVDRVRNLSGISDLQIVRSGTLVSQYGPGSTDDVSSSETMKAAIPSGQPQFSANEEQGYLDAVFPIVNSRNHLGNDCTGCHEGREGEALGAVKMRVDLAKAQARLQNFAWNMSLGAFAFVLLLLGAIYLLGSRFLSKQSGGGAPARATVACRHGECEAGIKVSSDDADTSSLMAAVANMEHSLSLADEQIKRAARSVRTASRGIASANGARSLTIGDQAAHAGEMAFAIAEIPPTPTQATRATRGLDKRGVGASVASLVWVTEPDEGCAGGRCAEVVQLDLLRQTRSAEAQ